MKKILTLIAMTCITMSAWAQDTWTVVGSKTICGNEWKLDDTSNDMTKNASGLWEFKREECVLEANSEYKFKVVKNHSWDEAYPLSDYVLTVNETATYTVTILFNETSHNIEVNTDKTGEAVIGEKTWTVAGDEALTGQSWKPEYEGNNMEKQADGTYKKVFEKRSLTSTSYKFKVCANGGWSEAYPSSDYVLSVTIPATTFDVLTDVTITFNPDTKEITTAVSPKAYNVVFNENEDITPKVAHFEVGDGEITVNRTLHAGHWNTICLPFWMSNENLKAAFGNDFKLAKLSGFAEGTIQFDSSETLEHHTPYMIWIPESKGDMTSFTVNFNWVDQDDETSRLNQTKDGCTMIGTLAPIDALESGKLFIANDKVYKSTGKSKMKAMSAYFEVPASSEARSFTFSIDGETTGIVSIDKDGCMSVNENVFDLQGRRVAAPQKGMYIVNGKKVVMK